MASRSKAGKTDPKALQRERSAFYEGVRRLEEEFSSSSGSYISDEEPKSQVVDGDFKSGSQPILPRYEVVIDKTFVNGFRFGFFGVTDVSITISVVILVMLVLILSITDVMLLRKGVGLRS
jgi:hypothetical protein